MMECVSSSWWVKELGEFVLILISYGYQWIIYKTGQYKRVYYWAIGQPEDWLNGWINLICRCFLVKMQACTESLCHLHWWERSIEDSKEVVSQTGHKCCCQRILKRGFRTGLSRPCHKSGGKIGQLNARGNFQHVLKLFNLCGTVSIHTMNRHCACFVGWCPSLTRVTCCPQESLTMSVVRTAVCVWYCALCWRILSRVCML